MMNNENSLFVETQQTQTAPEVESTVSISPAETDVFLPPVVVPENNQASSSPKNLWDDPEFPKTGWECVEVSDLGAANFICELCGRQTIRYVHRMRHPTYGDLSVGCVCAGKMEGDIERAKQREREFKRRQKKKQNTPNPRLLTYHEDYYLAYHGGKRITPLDLHGTQSFLQALGFDGGELRQARKGKRVIEDARDGENGTNTQQFCSYCGKEISGVEFARLPDGRLRCNSCSSTLVETTAEVEAIYQRVITNMDAFFGATIRVPVSIEVLGSRKLKKKLGVPLGDKDSQSILILGVALNKKGKYRILLENGAPRISLLATFAHELTHIWQYVHWDNQKGFKKCPSKNRLIVYEGMAKWAEIQFLYLIGETSVAKREEFLTRQRDDEYGIGFRLYEEQYPLTRDAMSCNDTPFTADRYPLD